ncbi:HAMP domain-containing protein, partial [Acinetobacter baumannii]
AALLFGAACFLLLFLSLNVWIVRSFARTTVAPLSRLKAAAAKIKEGDLDGGIAAEGEGEVRELSLALEAMRIKLKESVYWQRKYDDNRRFLV